MFLRKSLAPLSSPQLCCWLPLMLLLQQATRCFLPRLLLVAWLLVAWLLLLVELSLLAPVLLQQVAWCFLPRLLVAWMLVAWLLAARMLELLLAQLLPRQWSPRCRSHSAQQNRPGLAHVLAALRPQARPPTSARV